MGARAEEPDPPPAEPIGEEITVTARKQEVPLDEAPKAVSVLAGEELERAGFAEIEGGALDGYELDDADALFGHLSAEWIPSGRFQLRLGGFFHRSDQHGAAQKELGDPNPDSRELTQDFPSRFALDNQSLSATVDWEISRALRLRSLTGAQRLEKRASRWMAIA